MYKVLLVDDEKIARDSISSLIPWEAHQLAFVGASKNAFDALEQIKLHRPDIVITDIKMPVMDGLQLIAKVKSIYPETVFVVLSGYGEYEYTSQAMAYGIKHYLLKPCNENRIVEVMNTVKDELGRKAREEQFIQGLAVKLEKMLPLVKEQFLRDMAITGQYSQNDCEAFLELSSVADERYKVVLVMFDKPCDYLEKFALKNIAEDIFTEERICLSTIVDNCVLFLVKAMDLPGLSEYLRKTGEVFKQYYKIELFMAVSKEGTVMDIRSMYKEAKECLKFRYYIDEGGIITTDDIDPGRREQLLDIPVIFEGISSSVRSGQVAELNALLEDMFVKFEEEKLKVNEIKAYCIELFLIVIRGSSEELLSKRIRDVSRFQELESADAVFELLKAIANESASENYEKTIHKQNSLIQSVKEIVRNNIGNPELSLKWIANELLYMNEDYLGKVISRETGERFTQYVLNQRMELARQLIESRSDLKIADISRMTGFSEDAQYFSKVFKKNTGMTPSDYKNKHGDRG